MTSQSQRLREARNAFREGRTVEMNRLVSSSLEALQRASDDATRAELAHSLASFYRDIGSLTECAECALAAVDWVRRSGSVPLLGNHLMFLALLKRDAGRMSEAIDHASEALTCYVSVYGQEHREVRHASSILANMRQENARGAG